MRDKLGRFVKGHKPVAGFKKGNPSPRKGVKLTEKTKEKMSETMKRLFREGKVNPIKNLGKYAYGLKGKDNPSKRPEVREKISKILKEMFKTGKLKHYNGEKHYNWKGGKSFEPYGRKFNKQLKLFIRQRDNFTCQECNYTEGQLGYTFGPHHIDYNKKNNDLNNLILLCKTCNIKANFNREDWTKHFQTKIKQSFFNHR